MRLTDIQGVHTLQAAFGNSFDLIQFVLDGVTYGIKPEEDEDGENTGKLLLSKQINELITWKKGVDVTVSVEGESVVMRNMHGGKILYAEMEQFADGRFYFSAEFNPAIVFFYSLSCYGFPFAVGDIVWDSDDKHQTYYVVSLSISEPRIRHEKYYYTADLKNTKTGAIKHVSMYELLYGKFERMYS